MVEKLVAMLLGLMADRLVEKLDLVKAGLLVELMVDNWVV
jgi:hypothetical protein